jgi:cytochrome c biogenesis protein ResB
MRFTVSLLTVLGIASTIGTVLKQMNPTLIMNLVLGG